MEKNLEVLELLCIFAALFTNEYHFYIYLLKLIRMKKILLSVAMLSMALGGRAETQGVCQGWPADYDGVMLQGFWWDGYEAAKWTNLEAKADELSQYFNLIWVPNSGTVTSNPNATTQGPSMGYDPCYWLHHNSCFGTEDELRSMINTYKSLNVGIIEDVVINHKKGQKSWLDFPDEEVTVGNITYKIDWKGHPENYITCNDDCNSQGYATHGGYDTGDDFPGFRDLDHTSSVTQENIINYLQFLKNGLGYVGFRYDLVKGYAPGFIKDYNDASMPEFSVGEYWDDQTSIQNWIMNTGNRSAAFDFPLKYKINQAISNGDYSAFNWKSFAFDPNFSKYAVTFVDNHDTGREDHSKLVNNWSAANAFILASPGTPCIWYKHYLADASNIQKMIMARKACGITNTYCIVEQQEAVNDNSGYILKTVGHKGSLYLQLGSAVGDTPYGYEFVCSGDSYKLYSSINDFASVTVSPNGGNFTTSSQKVTFTVMNAIENGASYKVGDSETWTPITEDPIYIGEGVDNNTDITVYWRATGSDEVEHTGSVTFTKRASYPKPIVENNDEVSVFFETDQKDVKIWAWVENGDNYTGGAWENKPSMIPMGVNSAGKLVYKWTYDGDLLGKPGKVLFIDGSNQTDDFAFVNHGYYTASGLLYKLENNTVYFDNTVSDWDHVYYYAWTKNGECEHEWPGVELNARTDGLYEVSNLDGIYTSIIFNDPDATGVKQTEDLTVVDGKTYSLEANTVYFDNSQVKWDKVYYYAYTKDESPKEKWPGEVVTTTDDRGFFKVTLLDAYTTVIFNDGTTNGSQVGVNQTENLAVVDGEVYTISVATINTVSLPGSFNGWNQSAFMTAGDNNTWTASLDLTNDDQDVRFKLLVNGNNWLEYKDISFNVPKDTWVADNGDTNIRLNNATTNYKTYLFTATWTPCTSASAGWTLKIEGVDPRQPLRTLTVAGTESLLGSSWDPTDVSNDMTFCDDGTCYYLTKTVYLAAGEYEFKVVNDHNWDKGSYGDQNNNNYKFNIGSPGLYEVSFYYHPSDNHLSHNVVSKDVLEIVDGEPFEAGGNFANSSVAIATYYRAFKNNWGTLCLPFEIKSSYNGVTFYQLDEVNSVDKVLTFTDVSTVAAGQPVIYKAEDGVALDIEENDVAVAGAPITSDPVSGWTLHGTFTNQTGLNAPSGEYLYYIASNQFWQGIDTNMATYRAWFTANTDLLSGDMEAPFRIEVGDEQDIRVVEQEDGSVKVYYDLQGRRLGQTRKGLVIENGKLIFVK